MNVSLIAVDRLRESYLRDGCALYVKRLAPMLPLRMIDVRPSTKEGEADALLKQTTAEATVWALDRGGMEISSDQLATRLQMVARSGARHLALIIGGADGLGAAILARADFVWSLSPLTLLHEMTRLLVLEQLYRAVKINRGEPYHR
ncbi:MAG TPA: 23S rRNA (pseudouridine(1915)-N(3))-methyltransferase RlmH [Candidatus Eremiobacteraceae bacterium]|nr:23S rRNA (pseudouridine(1915)-N(3))-methyltransferase RlmH [Candidatus Eremiobacteraceae bacterium]